MTKVMATPVRETSASRIGPRIWRKHALPFTTFAHPKTGELVTITPELLQRMKENFDAKVRDIVPVPAKGPGGHSDDWRDSVGNTIGFEVDPETGGYVIIEVDDETDKAIQEEKLKGISLSFDPDWFDPQKLTNVGPVLRHSALTNIPYLKGLQGFERVSLSEGDDLIVLTEVPPKEEPMKLEEMLAALKKDHGIDVDALKATADEFESTKKRAEQVAGVRKALAGAGVELSETDDDVDLGAAVASLVKERTDLSEQVTSLSSRMDKMDKDIKRERAEAKVRPYRAKGLVSDAEAPKMIELAERDPETADFVLSKLSGGTMLSELGSAHSEDEPGKGSGSTDLSESQEADEIKRYAEMAKAS